VDSQNSSNSSDLPDALQLRQIPAQSVESGGNAARATPVGRASRVLVHSAEAIESKHRVRERLLRALSRSSSEASGDADALDRTNGGLPPVRTGLGLEANPLGEYLLNCELRATPFRL
jgi:hypothetical protein